MEAIPLERARAIAYEAHHGQTRRHGAPYIRHPEAVRTLIDDVGPACGIAVDDVTRAAALLHDVLEDNEVGIDAAELRARFGAEVTRRVELLTKTGKGPEATAAYYARLADGADDALRLVKVCDRLHNLGELHLAPSRDKLDAYVEETLAHVVPLARGASTPGLVQALDDGMRAACRAQKKPLPASLAPPAARVPAGLYAVVAPHAEPSSTAHGAVPLLSSPVHRVEAQALLDELERRAAALVEGGVAMVQLRAKGFADRDVLALLEPLLARCRPYGVPVIVNDRPDLCVAADADGVHVGQTDMPPKLARRIVGADALVGASSHTEPELLDACADGGADLVAVGPVFASPTKSGHAPVVGLEALARRTKLAPLPVVAIGGVTTPGRVADCARAGARLVAAVSALDVDDPRFMCRRMSLAFAAAPR